MTAQGAGLVDVTVIPHYDDPEFPDAQPGSIEAWAARMPGPTYALDDDSALVVVDGEIEVVSRGRWQLLVG